ncbi:ABC transporter permease [Gordonia sp. ABSL11-1]|uniref:ABC transporter permease n=1 Tax=Gordonia sp. ABSL11-1 TaxID=3053924 RepID=UPI00257288F5|nr:ABC transporter permease [Gordonia sp. ABSL11-1]MDL9947954.1 ABC transporter permease [Gordonia sp. ABSL11-1]
MTAVTERAPVTARPALVADSVALTVRHLRLMMRRPASIVGGLVLPVIFAVLFLTVFGRVMDRAGLDYPQYMMPAIVIQSATFAAMSGSVWAAEDASSGMINRLRAMPIARPAPVFSLLIGETVRSVVGAIVLLALGYGFGFRFQTGPLGVLAFLGLVIVVTAAICLPYLVLGYRLADVEPTQALGGVIYFPLLLVSTLFVPKAAYPGWLQPVVEYQPLSCFAEALRAVSTDGYTDAAGTVGLALIWAAGLLVTFGIIAPRVFGRTS